MQDLLKAFNLTVITAPGYEADDILGTLAKKARIIRWFGIDRLAKQGGTWENDIKEIGYKYQMTDLGASLGYTALKDFKILLNHRQKIFRIYRE